MSRRCLLVAEALLLVLELAALQGRIPAYRCTSDGSGLMSLGLTLTNLLLEAKVSP
jgi:hypothetical protein